MITDVAPATMDDIALLMSSRCRYASLHYARPVFSSPTASEVAFGGYSRQLVLWTEPSDGIMTNTDPLVWIGLEPPVTISAVGLNLDPGGGGLVAYGMLDVPLTSGQTSWRINTGALVLRVA